MLPRVSIGLPVFNGEKFLEQTLEALLEQTYENFELIISDNASTDRTSEICRTYAAKDRRIFYYRHCENMGAARNFNRVFEWSRGEYFKWAAVDDLCAPSFLQCCVEVLDRQRDAVICHPLTKIIDAQGLVLGDAPNRLNLQSPLPRQRFMQFLRITGECNAVFGLIRSSALERTNLMGNYIASDTGLLAELSLYGKIIEIPEYLFFRRDHPAASSRNKGQTQLLEFYDPKLKGRIVFPKWRRIYENWVAVVRAPVPLQEKALLFSYLVYSIIGGRNGYGKELLGVTKQLWRRPRLTLQAR
jgi:glycosyltransferase involved in cell wall biosynthesis